MKRLLKNLLNDFQHKQLVNKEKEEIWKEKKVSYGNENRDKIFYVIRRNGKDIGLFSFVITHLGHIKYAIEKGYIPVIDMMNYKNVYIESDQIGKVNGWELFFEQPTEYTMEDVVKSRNVILSYGGDLYPVHERPTDDMSFFCNENNCLDKWRSIFNRYMKLKPEIVKDIMEEYGQIVNANDRVLGVFIRGTDYVAKRFKGHPVQPEPYVVIQKAKEVMQSEGCNKVFVGTEDYEIAEMFRKEFGEKYITNQRKFIEYDGNITVNAKISRENDNYLQGKEYITTLYMLSMSDCIVASRTSGTIGIELFSKNWDYAYYYDLGRY